MVVTMFISGVHDVSNDPVAAVNDEVHGDDVDERDVQTASDMFDIMAVTHNIQSNDERSLTERDLILLYQNMDIGNQLMNYPNKLVAKRPNQHVETIVYDGDDESDYSEVNEIVSNDDLQDFCLLNNERIDLLNNPGSIEQVLEQRYGCIELCNSNLATEYNKNFLFQDPYIKQQLSSLNGISYEFENTILPTSLFDYISCKRLEDNYNFYMDNLIKYVNHTIEQLIRISNGDYLTDKAKQKWREVNANINIENELQNRNSSKILTNATSIPLHMERKHKKHLSTWDDIVHSEVDIRTLCKILEKKIVLEIPNIISGSYKLLSHCYADNLVIRCKKEEQIAQNKPEPEQKINNVCPQVDVVFQLKRSESGHVMNKISSIMILHKSLSPVFAERSYSTEILPLPYYNNSYDGDHESSVKVTEIRDYGNESRKKWHNTNDNKCNEYVTSTTDITYHPLSKTHNDDSASSNNMETDDDICRTSTSIQISDFGNTDSEADFDRPIADNLTMTIHNLNLPSPLPEENEDYLQSSSPIKRRSPTNVRVRIKSPYQNKSYFLDEKKRKKLLEIRDKRERRKMALNEKCKMARNKNKGAVLAQVSSSVTKLSITNKSFYDTIYGQFSINGNTKNGKSKVNRKDNLESESMTLIKPIVNRGTDNKSCLETTTMCSDSANENRHDNLSFSQMNPRHSTDFDVSNFSSSMTYENPMGICSLMETFGDFNDTSNNENVRSRIFSDSQKERVHFKDEFTSLDCRKSIDKLYDLMKTFSKKSIGVKRRPKTAGINKKHQISFQDQKYVQSLNSGTSIKFEVSSNSSYSLEKNNQSDKIKEITEKTSPPQAIVPKVIISSKLQTTKQDFFDKGKVSIKDRKALKAPPSKISNPLSAISQLLQDIDKAHKIKHKDLIEENKMKKDYNDFHPNNRYTTRQRTTKRNVTRSEQVVKDHYHMSQMRNKNNRTLSPKGRKCKATTAAEAVKLHNKNVDITKNDIIDIINETKEARGEAVRGPPRFYSSRLNYLAQPRKSYVVAHSEEFQHKYGRNLITDRLQRLATSPPPQGKTFITDKVPRTPNSPPSQAKNLNSDRSQKSSPSPQRKNVNPDRLQRESSPPQGKILNTDRLQRASPPPYGKNLNADRLQRASVSASPLQGKHLNVDRLQRAPTSPTQTNRNFNAEKSHRATNSSQSQEHSVGFIDNRANHKRLGSDARPVSVKTDKHVKKSRNAGSSDSRPMSTSNCVGKEQCKTNKQNITVYSGTNGNEKENESHTTRSRVPFVPNDLEFGSNPSSSPKDDASLLGVKLHKMIHSAVHNIVPTEKMVNTNVLKENDSEGISVYTDRTNIFYNDIYYNHHTNNNSNKTEDEHNMNLNCTDINNLEITCKKSSSRLTRMRSKNSNITSKKSLNKIIHMLKSSIDFNAVSDIALNPIKTISNINKSNQPFPLQITTVGYMFPNFTLTGHKPISAVQIVADSNFNKIDEPSQVVNNEEQSTEISQVTAQLLKDSNPNEHNQNDKTYNTNKNNKEETGSKQFATLIDPNNINCTSSLDILVNLLNEIQNITTCQTQMTDILDLDDNKFQTEQEVSNTLLEKTMNTVNNNESLSRNVISITSLDKLRHLESLTSIYSFYVSNNDDNQKTIEPLFKSKNVSCSSLLQQELMNGTFSEKYVNRCTDVPSQLLTTTVNRSTNVTNSLIGVFSQSSSLSLLKNVDCETYSVYSLGTPRKIIEIPIDSLSINKVKRGTTKLLSVHRKHEKDKHIVKLGAFEKEYVTNNRNITNITVNNNHLMKIKRDILVTVYSVLVLTVFAALSFPEIYMNMTNTAL